MSKKKDVEVDPDAEKWVAEEDARFDAEIEATLRGDEIVPPKCDECVSFDCENCPATYKNDKEEDEDEG